MTFLRGRITWRVFSCSLCLQLFKRVFLWFRTLLLWGVIGGVPSISSKGTVFKKVFGWVDALAF